MSILRHKVTSGYSVVPNTLLEDPDISWQAKGLLVYLLSRPEGWEVREAHLVNVSNAPRTGLAAVRSALAELEKFHYLRRGWENGDRGRLRRITEVSDQRCLAPVTDMRKSNIGVPNLREVTNPASRATSDSTDVRKSTAIVSKEVTSIERRSLTATVPNGTVVAPRRATGIQTLLTAVEKAANYPIARGNPNYQAAKKMAEAGITPKEVAEETLRLLRQPFWSDKPVSVSVICRNLFHARHRKQAAAAPPQERYTGGR